MKKNTFLALLLVLVLILCGCSGEKEEAYRMIQVLEVSGSVSVERTAMGTMDAYEGMRLESGDKITVGSESWLKIKMDEDKYALVEPASVLRLEASGSSADSKTVLHLESGAVSNRLEEKLGEGSSYEVNTPNSTMAVRGTVFRVEVAVDEDGISIANVSVYGGSVASRLIYPDGTMDSERAAVLIADGTTAQVWGNSILSRYVTTDEKLELDDLRLKTLEFLQEAREAGQELNVSPEKLEELITVLEQAPASREESGELTKETTVPTEETTAPMEETTVSTEETTVPTTAPRPVAPPPVYDDEEEEEEYEEEPETQAPATEAPTEAPAETTEPPTYTVTFRYNNEVFATQTVTSGGYAAEPKLRPALSGSWNFAFTTTPITADTTIDWS